MKIIAVIPAYNEERFIGEVVRKTKRYIDEVIVVDDGSEDKTSIIAEENGANVIRHEFNQGLGRALRSGIDVAIANGADIIITLDGDGQHDPDEITKFIEALRNNGVDFVIGSRFLNPKPDMPIIRKTSNTLSTIIVRKLTKFNITDSQSGFRAFSSKMAKKVHLKSERMEISTEFILEAKRNRLRIREVPIKSIFGEEKSSFQNLRDTIRFFRLLIKYLLY